MVRSTSTNYAAPSFPKATVDEDPFDAHDVQQLAAAVDGHDHTTGKGVALAAGSIPNGTITSAMIADTTIDTADLKDGAVTNAKLASDTARANLLTNGGFEVWQRGTGPFTATNAYSADRWLLSLGGTSTMSVSKETTTVDSGSGASAKVIYTHNATSYLLQKNEDYLQFRSRTWTVSVRVWCNTANAVNVMLQDGGGAGNSAPSAFHPGNSTWQTLSVTFAFNNAGTAPSILIGFSASCTAYLDNAMLVAGSVAADYAPLHPADDMARCLRYYEPMSAIGLGFIVWGYASGVSQPTGNQWQYKARKTVVPTVTKVGTWTVNNCGQPTLWVTSLDAAGVYAAASAAGAVSWYMADATTYFVAEANP